MNVERLKTLARFLRDNVQEEGFDLDLWASSDSPASCGATACAIGWATQIPSFAEAGLRLERETYGCSPVPVYQGMRGFSAAALFFGIPHRVATLLFAPENYDDDNNAAWDVAYRIETILGLAPRSSL